MPRPLAAACLALASALALAVTFTQSSPAAADVDQSSRVFELRTYHTPDGKLVDLHKRFRDHTCALLEKHGAELVGFWTPTDDKDDKDKTLIYLVAYPDRASADETWRAFREDPEWKRAKAASEEAGPLTEKVESVFLAPTDYSAMK